MSKELEGGAQGGYSDSKDMSWRERKERRRELRREMRELGYGHRHGLFAGIVLIVIGGLFLAANLLSFPISQWWPLILVVVGIAVLSRVFYTWD